MRHEGRLPIRRKCLMITLSVDPHPGTHTVVALDPNGSTLASITVPQYTRRPLPTAPVCSSVRLPSLGNRRSGQSFYRCVGSSTAGAKRDCLLDSPEPDQSIPIPPRSKEKRRG